jgi:hypothetical protein
MSNLKQRIAKLEKQVAQPENHDLNVERWNWLVNQLPIEDIHPTLHLCEKLNDEQQNSLDDDEIALLRKIDRLKEESRAVIHPA